MRINYNKLLGWGLILGSLPLFSLFFMMAIPVLFRPEGLADGEIFYMLLLFFANTGFGIFHWPAFVLITVGIIILMKTKAKKLN